MPKFLDKVIIAKENGAGETDLLLSPDIIVQNSLAPNLLYLKETSSGAFPNQVWTGEIKRVSTNSPYGSVPVLGFGVNSGGAPLFIDIQKETNNSYVTTNDTIPTVGYMDSRLEWDGRISGNMTSKNITFDCSIMTDLTNLYLCRFVHYGVGGAANSIVTATSTFMVTQRGISGSGMNIYPTIPLVMEGTTASSTATSTTFNFMTKTLQVLPTSTSNLNLTGNAYLWYKKL